MIDGSDLEATRAILFRGGRSRRDDVSVRPRAVRTNRVEAIVSERARTGPVTVVNSLGRRATTRDRIRVAAPPAPEPIDESPGSAFFLGGKRQPTFRFSVNRPMQARVELIREADGSVANGWDVPAEPGRVAEVRWDGRVADGGAPAGGYSFRLAGEASTSAQPAPDADTSFGFYDHLFPIRGRHDLGQGPANGFGGGRGHKGQDMFASCGTRIAAARGGRVEYAGFNSAAGNYAVVDGAGTDVDYVYMHMLKPPLVQTRDRVFTGQAIGQVGETGRATGCHLHFELWSGGWYSGGSAFDPLPLLREWDAYS